MVVVILALFADTAVAQVHVEGTVYDQTQQHPVQGVSVISTSGAGTMTDSLGRYSIRLSNADSIYFSYLGKATSKFPVKRIPDLSQFDMSLDMPIDSLPSVFVGPSSYRLDSLENRKEYKKLFDYDGSDVLQSMKSKAGRNFGISLNMDMMLDAKRNKRMENFQEFLVQEEHDKYIDHRFTRALVKRLTGMEPPALDTFMRQYRPTYEYLLATPSEWEFYGYIRDTGKFFMEIWKQEHPSQDSTKTTAVTVQ